MGKFIIEESEKTRILSLHKKLISENLENDDVILTYTKLNLGKYDHNQVYFNNVKMGNVADYNEIMDILKQLKESGELDGITLKLKSTLGEDPGYKIEYEQLPTKPDNFGKLSIPVKIDDDIKTLPAYKLFINDEKQQTPVKFLTKEKIDGFYKKVVRDCLKSIYGDTEHWVERGYGNKKRFGVVNVKSINDLMPEDLRNRSKSEGSDWSIINYFDTNPGIRKMILDLFQKESKLKVEESEENLKKWGEWIENNKEKLFKDGTIFEQLVDRNFNSYLTGLKNEEKAFKYVEDKLTGDFIMGGINLPGSPEDMRGIDFSTINKQSNKEFYFQAKPLKTVIKDKGEYIVQSYKIYYLTSTPVDYFIFTSHSSPGIICFKKLEGQFRVLDDLTIVFNYPPVFWDPNY